MRDLIVAAICSLGIPLALVRPFLGLLFFCWLAYMRLQDLSWGFAKDIQWSKYVAIAMIIGVLINKKEKFFRFSFATVILFLLWLFLTVSVIFSVNMEASLDKYSEYSKIFFVAALTVALINTQDRLKLTMIAFASALGFHGVKSGLIGGLRGGKIHHGPGGTIEDNNDFAMSLVMTIPILYYLGKMEKRLWLRLIYWGVCFFCMLTILWTHSRGGLLGTCTVLFLISWSWRNKILTVLFWVFATIVFFAVAPQSLLERYSTLKETEKDGSAISRLHSWKTAFYIGLGNPLTGAGPKTMVEIYWEYAPPVETSIRPEAHVAHNAYMQILADSGFLSFGSFLSVLFFIQWNAFFLRRKAFKRKEIEWCIPYAYMMQYSVCGYMICVIFLSQEYFEYLYQILAAFQAMLILANAQLKKRDKEIEAEFQAKREALKNRKNSV